MAFTASDICKIIFAIIFPPLGVFLERGCGADLLINILLTILGWMYVSSSHTRMSPDHFCIATSEIVRGSFMHSILYSNIDVDIPHPSRYHDSNLKTISECLDVESRTILIALYRNICFP
ncbi:hypothetical protein Agabi119p4_3424 [Agaricus bisporus var. burnettii]|uniref:Plasma membrane proteolipid 3 n=1 Tax=Agaricus bisporus var. burnettii TaxID=192524 RepID=A0A8H7KJA3_AGABI|nr:hypothetical protein Agabi119p4_3424 [Agaricus bisporus var. burnettii]